MEEVVPGFIGDVMDRRAWSPSIVQAEATRLDFRKFCQEAWHVVEPAKLVWGWCHDALCDHLTYVTLGEIRFFECNIAPRCSKSLITSVFYPVWDWLQDPTVQHLTGSYALQLAQRDALKSRRLIESRWFQARYGRRFAFSFDEKLKRQYSNDKGGRRVCTSTDAATTGEGGNRLIVDDPHNAKEAESDPVREGTIKWWDESLSSRLNDPNKDAWIVIGQRTAQNDLFGHIDRTTPAKDLVKLMLPNEFEVKRKCVTFNPATGKRIFQDPRKKPGELMLPERIGSAATARLKRQLKEKYKLQYQQDEKGGGGKILRRDAWQPWEGDPPECDLLITVYDTAFEEGEANDYSARTDWGVFNHRVQITQRVPGKKQEVSVLGPSRRCLILIGAWRDKVPYHELKKEARRHYLRVKPDYTLVEKKATGITLCRDLTRGQHPVQGLRKINVNYGSRIKMDKVERANIAAVVLDEGLVYYMVRPWADEVIDECAAFPGGRHDDWTDTVVNALQWLRRMNEVGGWEDETTDGDVRLFKRSKRFYG